MNLINTLINVLTGHDVNEAVLLEIRRRAGGILIGSISRLDRVSASELVIYYQNGRINGSARIKSTRQTLNRYEEAMRTAYPRITLHNGLRRVENKGAFSEIELDTNIN